MSSTFIYTLFQCNRFDLGEKGRGITLYKKLYYKECHFHRVVKDFMIQSGDFSEGKEEKEVLRKIDT